MIKISDQPNRVALDVNSTHLCENGTHCSAEVTVGCLYQFTCNASGSNPASNIMWLIKTKNRRGMGETEIPADWSQSRQDENRDWETWSQIKLQILPEDRHSSVVCRVMSPHDAMVFMEIVMKFQVADEPGKYQ